MRIKIDFKPIGKKLPILYRQRFMDLIISALKLSDETYEQSLYPNKGNQSRITKVVKPFAFAVSIPEFELKKEKFKIDNEYEIEDIVFYLKDHGTLGLFVSSYDGEFLMHLYNGVLKMDSFIFNQDLVLKVKRVRMLNERRISEKAVLYKTMSPVLIEDKNEKPILPDISNLAEFNENFNIIHDKILKDIRGFGLYNELLFTPVKIKKQVVKHTIEEFRKLTKKPYFVFTTFEGIFKLEGDERDLEALYKIGIGLRTGQGFGMVEVIG